MQATYREVIATVREGQAIGVLPKGDAVIVAHLRGAVMAFECVLSALGMDIALTDEALDAVLEETGVVWTE